mmetsp:Transcript_11030/g.23385  ORF Transcript_11030/g.23385 Transcript_11030/m.23385 type:complete len:222 (-) Transcript_11030:610-1275(-)
MTHEVQRGVKLGFQPPVRQGGPVCIPAPGRVAQGLGREYYVPERQFFTSRDRFCSAEFAPRIVDGIQEPLECEHVIQAQYLPIGIHVVPLQAAIRNLHRTHVVAVVQHLPQRGFVRERPALRHSNDAFELPRTHPRPQHQVRRQRPPLRIPHERRPRPFVARHHLVHLVQRVMRRVVQTVGGMLVRQPVRSPLVNGEVVLVAHHATHQLLQYGRAGFRIGD